MEYSQKSLCFSCYFDPIIAFFNLHQFYFKAKYQHFIQNNGDYDMKKSVGRV